MAITAILYTRPGCHLCQQASELLEKYGLAVTSVNIDENEELRSKYDSCIPVVEIDGRVRFRGQVNEVLLRRLVR